MTPYDPLTGIQAAVNHPNAAERVSLYEALEMFTATAAWSAFEEKEKGTIEPGKLADLVILDNDPFAVDAGKIGGITDADNPPKYAPALYADLIMELLTEPTTSTRRTTTRSRSGTGIGDRSIGVQRISPTQPSLLVGEHLGGVCRSDV